MFLCFFASEEKNLLLPQISRSNAFEHFKRFWTGETLVEYLPVAKRSSDAITGNICKIQPMLCCDRYGYEVVGDGKMKGRGEKSALHVVYIISHVLTTPYLIVKSFTLIFYVSSGSLCVFSNCFSRPSPYLLKTLSSPLSYAFKAPSKSPKVRMF